MKKITVTITTLGLLAILSCWLVFHISCKKEDDCSGCPQLSNEELNFICYNQGDKVVFKNDSTNIFDTLTIYIKVINPTFCSDPCNKPNGSVIANFSFSHLLKSGGIGIQSHNETPEIGFDGPSYNSYNFPLSGNTQTVTVNSTTYNDAYIVQVDSTTINHNGDQLKVPWKIYYSKSKGFVRFFMVNGQTWSKL
jgi:hypothetical protein